MVLFGGSIWLQCLVAVFGGSVWVVVFGGSVWW